VLVHAGTGRGVRAPRHVPEWWDGAARGGTWRAARVVAAMAIACSCFHPINGE
jgi:hypothetical protein